MPLGQARLAVGRRRWVGPAADLEDNGVGLAVVRVVVGAFSAYHGSQQIVDMADFTALLERLGVPLPALSAWLVVLGQVGLGGLLILGLFTRVAGVLMTVMFLLIHYTYYVQSTDEALRLLFGVGTLYGVESLSYAATGVFLACVGAGRYALDARVRAALSAKGSHSPGLVRFIWPDPNDVEARSRSTPAFGWFGFRVFIGALVVLHSVIRFATEGGMANLTARLQAIGLPTPAVVAWIVASLMLGAGLLLVSGLFPRASGVLLAGIAVLLFLAVPHPGGTVPSQGGARQVGFDGEEFVFLTAAGLLFATTRIRPGRRAAADVPHRHATGEWP